MSRSLRLALALLALTACQRAPSLAPRPLRLPAGTADSVRTEAVARGVTLHTLVKVAAPWRAYVLDVDLRCNTLQAVKGAPTSVGRLTTNQLLAALPVADRAIAAVNADFFLFAPPGVPTNAHVERGVMLSGPDNRPVFWRGANGAMGFDTLRVTGTLSAGARSLALTAWNRPAVRTNGVIDSKWGAPLDTAVRKRFWRLDPVGAPLRGARTITLSGRYTAHAPRAGDTLVRGDTLLLHLAPREAAPAEGEAITLSVQLVSTGAAAARTSLTDVVGGRPMLVTDSAAAREVETDGQASFRDLNPRTLLGLDRKGQRAWLAVVDGRQKEYSMGMTLRQEAELMLALGATRAINLDGGGSSALDIRRADGTVRTVNKPSDAGGERAVANALAVRQTCK
jgi:hypothetical protein